MSKNLLDTLVRVGQKSTNPRNVLSHLDCLNYHYTSIVHCRCNGQIFAPQDKVPCWDEFVLHMQCLFFEAWSFGISFTTALCVKSGLSEPHRSQNILVRSWTRGTACWSPICIINYLLEKPQIGLIPTLIDLVRAMRSPSSIDTGISTWGGPENRFLVWRTMGCEPPWSAGFPEPSNL